jgi:hypothetical protein
MDIIERLDAAIKTEDFWVGDQREDNILKDSKKIIEQLREALRFYAEWGIDAPAVDAIIEEDRGDKARAALNIVLANLENGDY